MTDSPQDPKETPNPDAAPDPKQTIGKDNASTIVGSDKTSTEQYNVDVLLDTIARTLVPEQQELQHTLPQTTLRPLALQATVDPTSSLSVRPRSIRPASDAAFSRSSDDPSEVIGAPDYLTMQVLGQGGMGTVHLARQVALGRAVAVKQIRAEHCQQQSVRDEFLTEAVLTGRLEHPNIVPIYEVGRSPDGDLFYSMKNIRGNAWSDTIGNLSLDENLDILINVCDAIAFAHAAGIIHRDLKPQNIMTGEFGEVLVLDWGLALTIGLDTNLTSFAGTPAFMAPEMVNPPFAVGPHSDIYLLGANLYMILTGKPPHGGKSGRDGLRAAANNEIESPDEDHLRKVDPSGELMGVALRAMATKSEDRYSTVSEFQQAIRDFRSHHESLELSSRAAESLALAQSSGDYGQYSRAAFGFEAAHKLWNQNVLAKEGFATSHFAWARCAEEQGDFDLALSLLDGSVPEQREMRTRVSLARDRRDRDLYHARLLRLVSLAAGVLILFGTIGFGIYQQRVTATLAKQADTISQQYEDIKIEQQKTITAMKSEAIQRGVAERERDEANRERETAERQLYLNHIQSAQREWETDNSAAAWRNLNRSAEDLRGWEYRYLYTLFNHNHQTLRGHTAAVGAVAFSPDGTRIVTGSIDKTLKLWDANTGKELLTLQGHADYINAVAFSPDGDFIASASWDKTLKLWDVDTGEEMLTLRGHTAAVSAVAFSPDGSRIVSASIDKTLKLWDVSTGEETLTLKGHKELVDAVAFSPDGSRIVSGSWDKTLKLWDANTGEAMLTIQGYTGGLLKHWHASAEEASLTENGYTGNAVAFSPDGSRIVSGWGNTLRLLDASTGEETLRLNGHNSSAIALAFSPDGSRIASGGFDNTVKLWDAGTGEEMMTLKGHTRPVRAVAFSPDGSRIVSASWDKTLKLWDLSSDVETMTLSGHTQTIRALATSPDGRRIVSASFDKTLKLWDAVTGKESLTLKGHTIHINTVAFSPDGSRIVSGSWDKTVRLWNASTGDEILTLKGHDGPVRSVAFSPNGSRIVSSSDDKTLKLWDADTGEEILTLYGHTDRIYPAAFSSDGSRIVSGSVDKTLKLWDARTGEEILTLKGHTAAVYTAAFNPDGTRIVSGGADDTLKLWNAVTGKEIVTLNGHTSDVYTVAFSPDGSRVASGGVDNTVKLWDAITGEERLTLRGHTAYVGGVAFSADGSQIVSGSEDRTLKIWDASGDSAFRRRQSVIDNAEPDGMSYHEYCAALGEQTEDWFAAAFHLGWLIALHPNDSSLQERRATAEFKLREHELAVPPPVSDIHAQERLR